MMMTTVIPIEIMVQTDTVTVSYDGEVVLSEALAFDPTHQGIGVGAGNGYYTSEVIIRDFSITPQ